MVAGVVCMAPSPQPFAPSGENGDEQQSREFWDWWESHELAFLRDDRPWERADVVVAGVGSPDSTRFFLTCLPATRKGETR